MELILVLIKIFGTVFGILYLAMLGEDERDRIQYERNEKARKEIRYLMFMKKQVEKFEEKNSTELSDRGNYHENNH